MSSQVHRCNGRIYDRNENGDLDITDNTNLVAAMYVRKQGSYTENQIYPYVRLSDLRQDLIEKSRKLASVQRPNHPWAGIDDFELLRSAGLFLKDYQSGQEGFTLAAVLLLGTDELIRSVLPHHRTDAILRKEDVDRYDDRDDIRTNLIESYERLRSFISKHLADKFYLEKDQRISLRDIIFREVISNLLIHREFTNPYPAKLVILRDCVYTENSNKPHGIGVIDPSSFSPYPKNPTIAKFFKEIGWVDELGSGVRNVHKYSLLYSGAKPAFVEGDVFKATIPLVPQVTPQDTPQDKERITSLLRFCE
ncbi:MAG: AAA family ATPase, partial [Bacillota bacterium]|nr:AAA family ATPase [Bacillota bacterium]